MTRQYVVSELRWRNFDARWENGRIIVKLYAESYKEYIEKRKNLGHALQKIGNDLAWDTEFIRTKKRSTEG